MPCDYHLLPHPGIQTLAPYIPGKSADDLAREQGITDIIKLASNENPLGCSTLVTEALASLSSHQIATYPAPSNHPLNQKLADQLKIDRDMLLLGNGSDALFTLMMTCFALHSNRHILIHDYAFITYSIQAKTLGIPIVSVELGPHWTVDIDALINKCTNETGLIFIANPNNPIGAVIKNDEIKRLLQNIPTSTLVVIDEAYQEYLENLDEYNLTTLLADHPNLIITRTFSKIYGLAGLRLGYAMANPTIISLLQRIQLPFTISQAALVAAYAALDDELFIQKTIQLNEEGLKQVTQGLINLNINLLPTAGNFLTFDYKIDAKKLYTDLQRYGIIVRPLHPYGLNNFIRVTIGTTSQNSRFLETLAICIKN